MLRSMPQYIATIKVHSSFLSLNRFFRVFIKYLILLVGALIPHIGIRRDKNFEFTRNLKEKNLLTELVELPIIQHGWLNTI